jgi:hypothetical protein
MREAALRYLEHDLGATYDPDDLPLREAHLDGALTAFARLGVLSVDECERWRERFAAGDNEIIDPGSELGPEQSRLAERYLTELIGQVTPIRREADPRELDLAAQGRAAINALHAVGALDDQAQAQWGAKLMHARAPWLEETIDPPTDGSISVGIWVPPETEEEAAEDARRQAEWQARPRAEQTRRVILGSADRRDDLAIVAVTVHEDAVRLYFHFLEPLDAADGDSVDHFGRAVDSLSAPGLRDDTGQNYEPVGRKPAASSSGGRPGPGRRLAVTGSWLYEPAPSPAAQVFTAERARCRWTLPYHPA